MSRFDALARDAKSELIAAYISLREAEEAMLFVSEKDKSATIQAEKG